MSPFSHIARKARPAQGGGYASHSSLLWSLLFCIVMAAHAPAQVVPLRIVPRPVPISTNSNAVVIINQTNVPTTGLLRLRNGDTLQGKLVAIDAQKQVRWENPNIRNAVELSATNIARIRLAPDRAARPAQANNCLLRLLNGDSFSGKLLSLDADKLVLDTWYAGQLTFPRQQLQTVRCTAGGSSVYEGPTGLDDWTISASLELADEKTPAWGYSRGVFYARRAGGIARDVHLPERAAIDLDISWKQFLQLTITIYTDSLQVYRLGTMIAGGMILGGGAPNPAAAQPGAGFYAVHLNQNTTYLMTVRKNGEISNSGFESVPGLDQKSRAHISIRVDKVQKTISLLIDGKLIKTWQEGGEFAGRGTALRFVQQGLAPVNLSHITVRPWDGLLEKSPDFVPQSTNDFVQLKNQDSFAAKLQQIQNGALSVQTSFGPLKVPYERVTQIDLVNKGATAPPAAPDAVRAYFADHDGSTTFKIEQWTEKKVVVNSPVFGRAEFNPAVFSWLDFTAQKPPVATKQ